MKSLAALLFCCFVLGTSALNWPAIVNGAPWRTSPPDFVAIEGLNLKAFSSKDCVQTATEIAHTVDMAYVFLTTALNFKTNVTLYVLNEADWAVTSPVPLFGMPNYGEGKLYVAGTQTQFWVGVLDFLTAQKPQLVPELARVYKDSQGHIDLSLFFNLLAIHELAHSFHDQAQTQFPRKWMNEYFADLCLHAFVEEKKPELLAYLVTFPQVYSQIPATAFAYELLSDFETLYSDLPPEGYAWFQTKFHADAKLMYTRDGMRGLRKLYNTFIFNDARLAAVLAKEVSVTLSNFMTKFPILDPSAESQISII
eukprot:GILK01004521.1.p1 GENE.GILK01004521.1~~GILK01004521.1.p1  ORF type:complete len:310 (+),score=46.80 GILK01004521.1:88-1017(+)